LRALCDLTNANPHAAADFRPIAVEARRCGLIPDMRSKVVGLARENNVLVADDFASSGLKTLPGVSSQVSYITLGSDGKRRIKLHFEYFE
jgi:hypothetical protein